MAVSFGDCRSDNILGCTLVAVVVDFFEVPAAVENLAVVEPELFGEDEFGAVPGARDVERESAPRMAGPELDNPGCAPLSGEIFLGTEAAAWYWRNRSVSWVDYIWLAGADNKSGRLLRHRYDAIPAPA